MWAAIGICRRADEYAVYSEAGIPRFVGRALGVQQFRETLRPE